MAKQPAIEVSVRDIPEVIAALEKAKALEAAARALVDDEWRAWYRRGEDVGTVSLADLNRMMARIAALRAALSTDATSTDKQP